MFEFVIKEWKDMEERILALGELLSINNYEYSIDTYKITEFKNNGTSKEYLVNGLNVEVENGIVMFNDYEDQLCGNEYILDFFLVSSVQDVVFGQKDEVCKIFFVDGDRVSISK